MELIGTHGEFDPGSGRTLAARLTHASRTGSGFRPWFSGERVRNTWATCRGAGDNPGKLGLIPHALTELHGWVRKPAHKAGCFEGPAAYQVVGEVTAHQADDA